VNAVTARCDVVSGLIGRWLAGTMRDADRTAYEQHLLFCPPCLAQSDKARAALLALAGAPSDAPPGGLVDRLTARVTARAGGG
jgi:Putative zinc-finger